MKKISLAHMKAHKKGRIVEISGGANLESRLSSMGIYLGKEVTKVSHVALEGAVAIKVGRAVIALGHGMAAKIIVDVE